VPVSLPFTLTESSVVAIIPARYHSTRLPGKPLVDIAGRPMIEHVYRRAAEARTISAVIVATDDDRIRRTVEDFGGAVWLTRPDHPSGTDRLAEVAAGLSCRIVVNVQGDEPLIDPAAIDEVVQVLLDDPSLEMSTACRPFQSLDEFRSPQVVKVVRDLHGRALYFSRSPIPYVTAAAPAVGSSPASDTAPLLARSTGPAAITQPPAAARAHVGLYAYRRDVLLRLAALPPTELERAESLEQLRALANGIGVQVVDTAHRAAGVDTPEDLERVRTRLSTVST
jgi:3-deoxy-manno-octulosonate cytidylyltransferase (CMP-KDO synthetase)